MEQGKAITINEAMSWKATLIGRHTELVQLRNQNGSERTTTYGANADKPVTVTPKYDAIALDKAITKLAMEIRKLDLAIKTTNFLTTLAGYAYDETVLGELQPAAK